MSESTRSGRDNFWNALDRLVAASQIVIDRPRGSTHPRYRDDPYPYDYGYLEGTGSGDDREIDVWIGDDPGRAVTAAICTIDLEKRDAELKILLGCGPREVEVVLAFHCRGAQHAALIERGRGS